MNLFISFHSIFQDEESSGWEEEVEDAGWEVDLEVAGREESSDGGQEDSEEEGPDEGVELNEGLGGGLMGLLQDLHPHTDLGAATSFTLL
jgi:hypothetical protein